MAKTASQKRAKAAKALAARGATAPRPPQEDERLLGPRQAAPPAIKAAGPSHADSMGSTLKRTAVPPASGAGASAHPVLPPAPPLHPTLPALPPHLLAGTATPPSHLPSTGTGAGAHVLQVAGSPPSPPADKAGMPALPPHSPGSILPTARVKLKRPRPLSPSTSPQREVAPASPHPPRATPPVPAPLDGSANAPRISPAMQLVLASVGASLHSDHDVLPPSRTPSPSTSQHMTTASPDRDDLRRGSIQQECDTPRLNVNDSGDGSTARKGAAAAEDEDEDEDTERRRKQEADELEADEEDELEHEREDEEELEREEDELAEDEARAKHLSVQAPSPARMPSTSGTKRRRSVSNDGNDAGDVDDTDIEAMRRAAVKVRADEQVDRSSSARAVRAATRALASAARVDGRNPAPPEILPSKGTKPPRGDKGSARTRPTTRTVPAPVVRKVPALVVRKVPVRKVVPAPAVQKAPPAAEDPPLPVFGQSFKVFGPHLPRVNTGKWNKLDATSLRGSRHNKSAEFHAKVHLAKITAAVHQSEKALVPTSSARRARRKRDKHATKNERAKAINNMPDEVMQWMASSGTESDVCSSLNCLNKKINNILQAGSVVVRRVQASLWVKDAGTSTRYTYMHMGCSNVYQRIRWKDPATFKYMPNLTPYMRAQVKVKIRKAEFPTTAPADLSTDDAYALARAAKRRRREAQRRGEKRLKHDSRAYAAVVQKAAERMHHYLEMGVSDRDYQHSLHPNDPMDSDSDAESDDLVPTDRKGKGKAVPEDEDEEPVLEDMDVDEE